MTWLLSEFVFEQKIKQNTKASRQKWNSLLLSALPRHSAFLATVYGTDENIIETTPVSTVSHSLAEFLQIIIIYIRILSEKYFCSVDQTI